MTIKTSRNFECSGLKIKGVVLSGGTLHLSACLGFCVGAYNLGSQTTELGNANLCAYLQDPYVQVIVGRRNIARNDHDRFKCE